MSIMKRNQNGAISLVGIISILLGVLLITTVVICLVVYNNEQKYKNHSNVLVAAAVNTAKQQQISIDTNNFNQAAKLPLVTYVGPEASGTVTLQYPKTWSAYIVQGTSSQNPVNGFFQPGFVPDTSNVGNFFALRLQVNSTAYDQVLNQFTGLTQQGLVSVAPYSLPKVPSVVGVIIKGQIESTVKNGIMIVLPLRNTTLQVWTEGTQFQSDFTTSILPNLSFSP
jgi:hypothetical protein